MKSEKFILYFVLTITAVFTLTFCFFAINTTLHYHFQQIAWQSGDLFRNYYLAFAGGPAEYLALFISQLFYSNLNGSVIVSVSGLVISIFFLKIIELDKRNNKLQFLLIPIVQIIFLALMNDYKFNFSFTINSIIVSGFLYLCTAIEKRRGFNVSFPAVIAGLVIYYVSGGMYFLIFMVSTFLLVIDKSFKKAIINGILVISVTLLLPYIAHRFVFLSSLNNAYFRSTPEVAAMLRYDRPFIFYIGLASIPAILFLAKLFAVLPNIKRQTQTIQKQTDKSKTQKPKILISKKGNLNVAIAIQIFLLIAFSGTILYMVYKPFEKTKVEIDFYANQQDWTKVITLCDKMDSYDRMVNFQYNRALSNSGQLLEKLYNYEQKLGSQGLFLDKPFTSEVALPNSDIYFDLGNIDESQRYAFESETLIKSSPRALKRLILNCIIMNKMDAASTYINILAANPMERKWVKKYREYISNPKLADSDPLIMQKRKDMSKTGGMLGTPPIKLLSQLEKNPANKTAFEYLIAIDLMEHDVASLTEDLKYLGQVKYDKLPTTLEEAIILYRTQGKNNVLFNMIRISEPTTERFREFAKLTSAAKGDREKAKQATLAYKNTYWYYVLFLSPRVTNLKLDTKPVDANY